MLSFSGFCGHYRSAAETDHVISQSRGQIRGVTSTSAADVTSPSLLTTEAAEVYFGAGLLSLARVCRISPDVQTDF